MFQVVGVGLGSVLADRVLASWWTWRRSRNNTLEVALSKLGDYMDDSEIRDEVERAVEAELAATKAVRAELFGCFRIQPLAPNVCRVIFVAQGISGGLIPQVVLNMKVKNTLTTVDLIRDKMERTGEVVDAELRASFPVPPRLQDLSEDQRRVVDESLALETEAADVPWKTLAGSGPMLKTWIKILPATEKRSETVAWGKAVCTLDCRALTALGWSFDWCSRARMKVDEEERNPARIVYERKSVHDQCVAMIKKTPRGFRDREFVMRQMAFTLGDTFVYAAAPPRLEGTVVDYGFKTGVKPVQGRCKVLLKLEPSEHPNQCTLELYQYLDSRGSIPAKIRERMVSVGRWRGGRASERRGGGGAVAQTTSAVGGAQKRGSGDAPVSLQLPLTPRPHRSPEGSGLPRWAGSSLRAIRRSTRRPKPSSLA
jgi:hypothetical protein